MSTKYHKMQTDDLNNDLSKGSDRRPGSHDTYKANWDTIFGKKADKVIVGDVEVVEETPIEP